MKTAKPNACICLRSSLFATHEIHNEHDVFRILRQQHSFFGRQCFSTLISDILIACDVLRLAARFRMDILLNQVFSPQETSALKKVRPNPDCLCPNKVHDRYS